MRILFLSDNFPPEGNAPATRLHEHAIRWVRDGHDVRAFVQYNSTTDRVDFNVRLRYAVTEGTDLWLVYNEGLDMEREIDVHGEYPPRMLVRTLILKYSHTLTL